MTGVDSTTAKPPGSPAAERVANFNPATFAVYAFVALLAALIIFGAFATPHHRHIARAGHFRRRAGLGRAMEVLPFAAPARPRRRRVIDSPTAPK